MTKILIIGFGNTLRRDDGAGVQAVTLLQDQLRDPDCEFMTAVQPLPEMIAYLKDVDVVIFVDACLGQKPGVIQRFTLTRDKNTVNSLMTHHLSPERMLYLCERLYGQRPQGMAFTITGYDFGYGEGLSAVVEMRLPRLVASIANTVRQLSQVCRAS